MSSYYNPRKLVVNRYWKRPKPKVYECNIRDAERFYQESYKDYLQSKEYGASRAFPSHARSIEDEFASKWSQYRANSNLDSSRSDPFLRERREGSLNLYGDGGSSQDSGYRGSKVTFGGRDEDYGRRNNNRASSLYDNKRQSPDVEIQSIDDRLERLRKLRDDLGLPAENESNGSVPAPSSKPILKNSRRRSPSDTSGRMVESTKSYSSNSRSRANDLTPNDFEDRMQTKTERSTRFARQFSGGSEDKFRPSERAAKENGKFSQAIDDDLEKYSVRNYMKSSEKKAGGDDSSSYKFSLDSKPAGRRYGDDAATDGDLYKPSTSNSAESKYSKSRYGGEDDSSSKYSSETKSSRTRSSRQAEPVTNAEDSAEIDDEFVTSLRKKFPTSDEIIDRINKMEVE